MLNNEFPPLGGGTASVNEALLRHFEAAPDLEIDLLTSALGREYEEERFQSNARILKVPVNNQCIHHSSNRELLSYAWQAFFLSRKLHRETPYDLCFAWSAVPAGAIACGLSWLDGLPYIVRVGGPDIPGFEARYRHLYPFLRLPIQATWRSAQKVIAKCDHELQMIRGVDSKMNPRIIRNGVDVDHFRPGRNRSEADVKILSVGRLIERKGHTQILEAVATLRNEGLSLAVVFVGTGDHEASLKKIVSKLKLDDSVQFQGYVPREQMPEVYQDADIFVLASENEGMSVATLEALASGLPLVATLGGGIEEMLEDDKNGYSFRFGDVAALAEHLKTLALDPKKRETMGIHSRERAEALSWEEVASEYRNLFRELTGR